MTDNNEENTPEVPKKRHFTDDLVIIVVIGIGGLVSIVNYTWAWYLPKLVVAVFLSAAIASLVYRFMGGISPSTKFDTPVGSLGNLQLTGALAALIGCGILFSFLLPKRYSLDEIFTPKHGEWVTMGINGYPIDVQVAGVVDNDSLKAKWHFLESKTLLIERNENDDFDVSLPTKDSLDIPFKLGKLKESALKNLGFTATIDSLFITKRPEAGDIVTVTSLSGLSLKVESYGDDYSRFRLLDKASHDSGPKQIQSKGALTIRLGDQFYVVAVVELNHASDNAEGYPWSKFAVGKVDISLTLE